MSILRELACSVRGGHRWKTDADAEGSLTYCVRCEKVDHAGTEFDPPGDPKKHAAINSAVGLARTAGITSDAPQNVGPP